MLLTQKILLHLAHGVARQLFDNKALLGDFEVGQACFECSNDSCWLQHGAGFGNHHRHTHFTKVRVRHADQCAFGYAPTSALSATPGSSLM